MVWQTSEIPSKQHSKGFFFFGYKNHPAAKSFTPHTPVYETHSNFSFGLNSSPLAKWWLCTSQQLTSLNGLTERNVQTLLQLACDKDVKPYLKNLQLHSWSQGHRCEEQELWSWSHAIKLNPNQILILTFKNCKGKMCRWIFLFLFYSL